VPGRGRFCSGALDRGDFDATLLDLRRFDAYRAAHPDTKTGSAPDTIIRSAPIAVYVGLASDPALLVAVNAVLSDLQAAGTTAETRPGPRGLTYFAAPRNRSFSATSG